MSKVKMRDVDRNCERYNCSSCIIPCSSCLSGRCDQCGFGYKTIVEKLIEAYSSEDLIKYSSECPYAKLACSKLKLEIIPKKEVGEESKANNPMPEIKDGFIIENEYDHIGIVIGGKIRYDYGCADPTEEVVKAVYEIKEGLDIGLTSLTSYCSKDEYLNLIWKKNDIEQSLDNYELGTKLKIKLKENGSIITMKVGTLMKNKILLEGVNCYAFNENIFEIIGVEE